MNRVRFIKWRMGRVLMASLVEWLMKTEMYRIVFSNDAKKDLKELSKKAPQAVKKLSCVSYLWWSYWSSSSICFRALQKVANLARIIIWRLCSQRSWSPIHFHFFTFFATCQMQIIFLPEKLSPICPKNISINDGFCIFAKIRVICQTINHAQTSWRMADSSSVMGHYQIWSWP